GRVVHEDIDPAELTPSVLRRQSAKLFPSNVPRDEQTSASLTFHEPLRFSRVFVFVEINDDNVRAFLRVQDRHRPTDPAVPAGNECDPIPQLPAADIIAGSRFRLRPHFVLAPRLAFLMLRRADLFLFRHRKNHSLFDVSSDVSAVYPSPGKRFLIFPKKNRFSRLTLFSRWLPC